MTPFRIDFAPRSFRRAVVRTAVATWLIAALGIVLCIRIAMAAWHLGEQYQADSSAIIQVKTQLAERQARQMPLPKLVISASQAAAVNQAVTQLNLPWRDVLDAIEAATPGTIALLNLEPDAKKRVIRGLAEAKTADAMIGYVERLKQQEFFDAVVLLKHEVNEQDPNKPVRFQFEAHWGETPR